jgi:hypothetical protein
VGGYGSGRPRRNQLAEHCRKLDVNRLNREGCLKPGWSGNWRWHNNGVQVAGISLSAQQSQLVVSFRITEKTGNHYDVEQSIPIIRSPCNYGGNRPFFGCPGVVNGTPCRRRVAKLFKGGRYFLCRHCYSVAYASQSEDNASRMLSRANSLRMALGGEPGTAHWIAPKPKGMWQRTYEKHCSEIEWFEYQADHHFIVKFAHLLSDEDREMYFGD